jgi:acyl-coenzyme A thioesterase PaaI-like protein
MPLVRLLAINLGIGVTLALLLVGGLLVLNPGGLRDLILADRSPLVPIGLLLGGFVVMFASTAMGTAIMTMGIGEQDDEPRGGLRAVKQETVQTPVTGR